MSTPINNVNIRIAPTSEASKTSNPLTTSVTNNQSPAISINQQTYNQYAFSLPVTNKPVDLMGAIEDAKNKAIAENAKFMAQQLGSAVQIS